MAKRTRDYKAEYARADATARSRGFSSAYSRKKSMRSKDYEAAGYASFKEYEEARKRAYDWSSRKSIQQVSSFSPAFTAEQAKSYSKAFAAKSKSKTEFIEDLAAYLHESNPEAYPNADDWEFWQNY